NSACFFFFIDFYRRVRLTVKVWGIECQAKDQRFLVEEKAGMGRRNAAVMAWEQAKRLALLLCAVSLVWRVTPGWSEELSGAALVQGRCAMCHAPQPGDKLEAIESVRKTPEGWEMTLDRMIRAHGLRLQPEEGGKLVKYLSDHYGLAPAEVAPYQQVLEKRIN